MARIPYVGLAEVPPEQRPVLESRSKKPAHGGFDHSLEGGPLNVYRALANDMEALEGVRSYMSVLWRESRLSPHQRELIILTTAHATESAYEWHQHVRVALNEGLTPEQIRAVANEESEALDGAQRALIAYVRRFIAGTVDDDTHENLLAHHEGQSVVGIGLLAGFYLGLARQLDALDIDLESEFVGWELENL